MTNRNTSADSFRSYSPDARRTVSRVQAVSFDGDPNNVNRLSVAEPRSVSGLSVSSSDATELELKGSLHPRECDCPEWVLRCAHLPTGILRWCASDAPPAPIGGKQLAKFDTDTEALSWFLAAEEALLRGDA